MLRLGLPIPADRPLRVLAMGAHPDDIEIGAGGTLIRLLEERPATELQWVVLGASPARAAEARAGAQAIGGAAGKLEIVIGDLPDGRFPAHFDQLKDQLEALKAGQPDLVLVPRLEDRHQDHRLLAEVAWQTFRDHLLWEYEIPKYEGDLGAANVYVPLTDAQLGAKLAVLNGAFPSQHDRHWFSDETFRAVLRLRGIESHAPAGWAEAFVARKLVF
jgi:LmbE family N-acetylglucosaminyl deacetylase